MKKGFKCLFVKFGLIFPDRGEIHRIRGKLGNLGHIFWSQELLLYQKLRADQQGISCENRIALIGGIPQSGGTKGQNLPQMLSRSVEKVHKIIGALSQIPDSVGRGEGSGMQQNAAVAVVGVIVG